MKIQKLTYIGLVGLVLMACSPRVPDVFDDTSVNRLDKRRTEVMNLLINQPNGWVMEYFAQADPTSSDVEKHQGYTFLMEFRTDGTVTVGAPVDGVFKTETSMWDVINDNSTVLTFNTFNHIFHYYSNPDPALGLWGADGEGIGGDYEFLVLQYNETENYQLLKGKKHSCYIRMYPLAANQEWEGYFSLLGQMDQFIFGENTPLDYYDGNTHLTLYNGKEHEFRAFTFGADTLGGGSYYGLIVTPKGLRIHGGEFQAGKETIIIPMDLFALNEAQDKLVSVNTPNIYMTVDGATAFVSDANNGKPWRIDGNSLPAAVVSAKTTLDAAISAVVANSYVTRFRWEGAGDKRVALRIYYSVGGGADNSYDTYYFNVAQTGKEVTLTADDTYSAGSILYQFGGLDLVHTFNGTYTFSLQQGFHPSQGLTGTKSDDATFVLHLNH